ncbi:hypothetical protein Slin15195_G025180 [Septoria linicola]|uniref:Uncharacterized protein n=1 Tax=Septoria linicola TaxID=215465 RepID=A0A9Q9EGR6_9PEZI|nr:hypothetical protein Slin14017_G024270 [Septoria linicola]USW49199.1 hypothetical protein Slin15195_G025180 [Septoria linicola]
MAASNPIPNPHVSNRMNEEIQQWDRQERSRGVAPREASFQPHHSITVRAPDLQLVGKYVDDVGERYVSIEPPRIGDLWNPFDQIVYDNPTTVRQGRRDRDENSFTSITPVEISTSIDDQAFAALGALPHWTADEFSIYLNAIQNWAGETLLRVVSYQGRHDEVGNLVRTVMCARTVFPKPDGSARLIERYFLTRRSPDYSSGWPLDGPFSLHALRAPGQAQLSRDLIDVLRGDSTRAIKHRMLEYQTTWAESETAPVRNRDDDGYYQETLTRAYDFRTERVILAEDYATVLRAKFSPIHPSTLPADSSRCVMCDCTYGWEPSMMPVVNYTSRTFADTDIPDWTPYVDTTGVVIASPLSTSSWTTIGTKDSDQDSPTRFAIKLACGPGASHYMCHTCLISHFMRRGTGARCPFCKRLILTDREQDQIKYDVFPNPLSTCPQDGYIYLDDADKWTRPEQNFATDPPVRNLLFPTNNPHMLFDLWLDIVKLDDTYPDNIDHRCTLRPEWPSIVNHLYTIFRSLPLSAASPQGPIFTSLKSSMTATLRGWMAPREIFYSATLRNSAADNRVAARKMKVWPSGMEAFFDRNLSRVINFVRLRACDCKVEEAGAEKQWNEDRKTRSWRAVHRLWAQHWHGDRQFYSPKVYDKLMLSVGESWRD